MRSSLNRKSLKELSREWTQLQSEQARLRARDAAQQLGCSEAELVATGLGSGSAQRLTPDALDDLLAGVAAMNGWMLLARTDPAVLEVQKVSGTVSEKGGEVLSWRGPSFQLDLWKPSAAFIFYTQAERGPARGIQIFDPSGTAVLKLFLSEPEQAAEADALTAPWLISGRPDSLPVEGAGAEGLRFTPSRPGSVDQDPSLARSTLTAARDAELPVILSVRNGGCLLSVTHTPRRLVDLPPWFNILDPEVNLHLRENLLTGAACIDEATRTIVHLVDAGGLSALAITVTHSSTLPTTAAGGSTS